MRYAITMSQQGGLRHYGIMPINIERMHVPPTEEMAQKAAAQGIRCVETAIGRMMGYSHFAHLVTQGDNLRGAEIGVDCGDGLARMLRTGVGHIDAVDPWIRSNDGDAWTDVPQEVMEARHKACKDIFEGDRVTIHRTTSEEYWSSLEPASLDWVHVDGDHYAPGVTIDAVGAYKALKSGGIVAFDDCHCGKWQNEIAPVVERVAKEFGLEFLSKQYDPWILRKP